MDNGEQRVAKELALQNEAELFAIRLILRLNSEKISEAEFNSLSNEEKNKVLARASKLQRTIKKALDRADRRHATIYKDLN